MQHSPRSRFAIGSFVATTALCFLALLPTANAQKPSAPSSQSQSPSPRKITVVTNENLKYTVLTQPEHSPAVPSPQATAAVQPSIPVTPEDAAQKAAEIASLQKQIREKQKRIELLMHLFVTDEKKFVQFPSDVALDPEAQARIRSEQEELRRETSACAQLQSQLDALQGSPATPH